MTAAGHREPALVAEQVSVDRGGVRVVDAVDLVVPRGEWVAVVGPNGAGKTSFLHAVAGLVPRASGRLRVMGLDPAGARRREVARVVALVPQRAVVPEGVTVSQLVSLGRTPHIGRFGRDGAGDRAVVQDALARLELEHLAGRAADRLSGGELQRVVLARALAQQPAVLLLDEPTSALDLGHQQSVLDLVDGLRRDHGITVLSALHDLTLAAQYAHRLVLLDSGRLLVDDAPAAVLSAGRLADVYGARVEVLQVRGRPAVVPVRPDRYGQDGT